jgi:hypothetical protein
VREGLDFEVLVEADIAAYMEVDLYGTVVVITPGPTIERIELLEDAASDVDASIGSTIPVGSEVPLEEEVALGIESPLDASSEDAPS